MLQCSLQRQCPQAMRGSEPESGMQWFTPWSPFYTSILAPAGAILNWSWWVEICPGEPKRGSSFFLLPGEVTTSQAAKADTRRLVLWGSSLLFGVYYSVILLVEMLVHYSFRLWAGVNVQIFWTMTTAIVRNRMLPRRMFLCSHWQIF